MSSLGKKKRGEHSANINRYCWNSLGQHLPRHIPTGWPLWSCSHVKKKQICVLLLKVFESTEKMNLEGWLKQHTALFVYSPEYPTCCC